MQFFKNSLAYLKLSVNILESQMLSWIETTTVVVGGISNTHLKLFVVLDLVPIMKPRHHGSGVGEN